MIRAIKPISLVSGRELLHDYVLNAKEEVLVRSGELYSGVWGHPDIETAFREKADSTKCSFICGPYIDVLDRELIKLAVIGKLKLYRQKNRTGQHYRVFDGGKVFYFEDDHPIFAPSRRGLYIEGNEELGKEFRQEHVGRIESSELTSVTAENYLDAFKYVAPVNGSGARLPTDQEITQLIQYVNGTVPSNELVAKVRSGAEQAMKELADEQLVLATSH